MFRIWVPDFDSPSYFVAIATVKLGLSGPPTRYSAQQCGAPDRPERSAWIGGHGTEP
jgi:hypothetical protein